MTLRLRPPFHLAALLLAASCPLLATAETDERIVAAARASYNFNTYLKDDKVTIASKHGAVTLTGKVQDEFHRELAEATLAGLPGVKSVNNQLSLAGEPAAADPDARLRARAQTALLFHRRLSTAHAVVQVDHGVLTLRGEAEDQAQKDLAGEYLKGLEGVVRVDNDMTVAGAHPRRRALRRKIDDASITAQVKMALLFNKSTSAVHTQVRTDAGVVTLTGAAGSRAEKQLVTRIVKNIEGIRRVLNRMTVEE